MQQIEEKTDGVSSLRVAASFFALIGFLLILSRHSILCGSLSRNEKDEIINVKQPAEDYLPTAGLFAFDD